MNRQEFLRALLATGAATAASGTGFAQEAGFPSKPLRWLLGYPPGGGSDFVARQIGEVLSKRLGQPLVVDNRPGAATIIAADLAAKAPADGYTVFTGDNGSMVFNQHLYEKLPYDPAKDFAPVGLFGKFHMLLVVPETSPYRDARELVADMKRRNGQLAYGSPGPGSPHHLAMELFQQAAAAEALHVPYKGAGPAITDLISGMIAFMFLDMAAGLPQIKGGKVRPLAVASLARLKSLPNVPTLDELGFKRFEAYAWQGLVVPAATPRPVIAKLNHELSATLKNDELRAKLTDAGVDPLVSTPEEFRKFMQEENTKWGALIKEKGIRLKT